MRSPQVYSGEENLERLRSRLKGKTLPPRFQKAEGGRGAPLQLVIKKLGERAEVKREKKYGYDEMQGSRIWALDMREAAQHSRGANLQEDCDPGREQTGLSASDRLQAGPRPV